jgi:hypothetical protein
MIEILKQVLEALIYASDKVYSAQDDDEIAKAIISVRQAIAELEKQEPVVWIDDRCLKDINNFDATVYANGGFDCAVPLYTSPQLLQQCKGIPRKGCNYLATCGSICNKCGKIHHHHQMVAQLSEQSTQPRKPLTEEEERKEFIEWCLSVGLMSQSHGLRSEFSDCKTAWMAWQARATHGIKE